MPQPAQVVLNPVLNPGCAASRRADNQDAKQEGKFTRTPIIQESHGC
ncbi:hypothetical protein [Brasilonema sp. UFV-L1]